MLVSSRCWHQACPRTAPFVRTIPVAEAKQERHRARESAVVARTIETKDVGEAPEA